MASSVAAGFGHWWWGGQRVLSGSLVWWRIDVREKGMDGTKERERKRVK